MSDTIIHTTDASFEADVLQSELPTLVDFWAPWCGPCKMIAPILEELAIEYAGKIKVCKVKSSENDLQIVCGAQNARAGIKVVLAKLAH